MQKAVLTIATGGKIYIDMSCNLARSFKVWHDESDIKFCIATDKPEKISKDVERFAEIIHIEEKEYGHGFSPKLHIDEITPAEKTLFIDADCLITGKLEKVFDRFKGHSVSTVGSKISKGDWWGDVEHRCRKVGVEEIPIFVGCLYYINNDKKASSVYRAARSLKDRYDDLGMIRLRGVPNEEPLLSLAMQAYGQEPIPDDGQVKADAMSYPSGIEIDVFEGRALFTDYTTQEHLTGTLREARPRIAHFNDTYTEEPPYTREVARLRKVQMDEWPLWAAGVYATIRHTIPYRCLETAKDVLRPLYRSVFGTRSVKENPRVSE